MKSFDYLISAGIAFVLSLGLTPLMAALSRKLKVLDIPDRRKAHSKPMPLMGGVAMYVATGAATVIYVLIISKLIVIPDQQPLDIGLLAAFMMGITGVTAMGFIDDVMHLSAKRRLVILFILALIVLVGCLKFYFPPTLTQGHWSVVLLVSVIVVVWIVAVTNAVNFADGLDGLASSLALVSAVGFAMIFYLQGRTQLALPTALALCGAILGFLPFNISPAKLFMGDAGSMFIGFMLGIFSIMSMSEEPVGACVVPVYLMLMPVADMGTAVLRRLIMKKPMMMADMMHFHHILNRKFKNQRITVLILTAVQAISAAAGVLIYRLKLFTLGWILIGVIAAIAIVITVYKARRLLETEKAERLAGAAAAPKK